MEGNRDFEKRRKRLTCKRGEGENCFSETQSIFHCIEKKDNKY